MLHLYWLNRLIYLYFCIATLIFGHENSGKRLLDGKMARMPAASLTSTPTLYNRFSPKRHEPSKSEFVCDNSLFHCIAPLIQNGLMSNESFRLNVKLPLKYKVALGLLVSGYSMATNRFSSTLLTTASICMDYRLQFMFEGDLGKCHRRSAFKLKQLCANNGGLFIKAAQHLSSMDHILPEPFIQELSTLQDSAKSSPLSFVKKLFKEEIGVSTDEVFSEICETPIGSASIGQVHLAKLKGTGELVALKIQHPNIKRDSEIDLRTLSYALKVIKLIFPSFDFDWLIDELKTCLADELNFKMEADNSKITKSFFENHSKFSKIVQIPKVYDNLTSERVLTMEFHSGFKISEDSRMKADGIDLNQLNSHLFEIFMEMVFNHGFVHCDPHPGNILINYDQKSKQIKVILLDHGIYKRVPDEVKRTFSKLYLAILGQNSDEINEISNELNISSNILNQFSNLINHFLTLKKHDVVPMFKDLVINQSDNTKKEASEAFKSLPREYLFLIKLLDLLRSNERLITRHTSSRTFPDSLKMFTSFSMSALNPNIDRNSYYHTFKVYRKLFNFYYLSKQNKQN